MANTYTQIHIHLVFAVQGRQSLISKTWKEELHKYITAIIQKYDHKMLAINSMPDHIHIFLGMRPTQALSDLMQEVKQDSSKWINSRKLSKGKFSWQSGFGAFSHTRSHVDRVISYIHNQEEHHKRTTFLEEYIKLLEDFGVEYNPAYLFKPLETNEHEVWN